MWSYNVKNLFIFFQQQQDTQPVIVDMSHLGSCPGWQLEIMYKHKEINESSDLLFPLVVVISAIFLTQMLHQREFLNR